MNPNSEVTPCVPTSVEAFATILRFSLFHNRRRGVRCVPIPPCPSGARAVVGAVAVSRIPPVSVVMPRWSDALDRVHERRAVGRPVEGSLYTIDALILRKRIVIMKSMRRGDILCLVD